MNNWKLFIGETAIGYKTGQNFIAADLFISITRLEESYHVERSTSSPKSLLFLHDSYTFPG